MHFSNRQEARELLKRYPKPRPPLPEAHRKWYLSHYRQNRQGVSGVSRVVSRLESWMHRSVAKVAGSNILELGAGTLNHIPFEAAPMRYDVIEPFHELWADSPERGKVARFYNDIRDVPSEERYDKILSVAVLEHLTDLPGILAECALRMANGGAFVAGIPSEGGLAWYSAWRFGTGTAYRLRTGLSYAPLMRHEHVNSAPEIETLVRYFFRRIERSRFPVPLFQASLYTVLIARDPDLPACGQWLEAKKRLQSDRSAAV
jgi:SAM-dependent methyltransferase